MVSVETSHDGLCTFSPLHVQEVGIDGRSSSSDGCDADAGADSGLSNTSCHIGSTSSRRRRTRKSSSSVSSYASRGGAHLLPVILAAVLFFASPTQLGLPFAHAQTEPTAPPAIEGEGDELCACNPAVYSFTLDFSQLCPPPGVEYGADTGLGQWFCRTDADDDSVTDLVPVTVTSYIILELDKGLQVIKQFFRGELDLQDGDTFEYTSVTATGDVGVEDIPGAMQMALTGLNAAGDEITSQWIVTFTNRCDVLPFEEGDNMSWAVFSELVQPRQEICDVSDGTPFPTPGPGSPTAVPTPTLTLKPIPEPTDPPTVVVEPTTSPTVVVEPTASPTVVVDPTATDPPTIVGEPTATDPPTTAGEPTDVPTTETEKPTRKPSTISLKPIARPTGKPTKPGDDDDDEPTAKPTKKPTKPDDKPTKEPSLKPDKPTKKPTSKPTKKPSGGMSMRMRELDWLDFANLGIEGLEDLEDDFGKTKEQEPERLGLGGLDRRNLKRRRRQTRGGQKNLEQ